MYKYIVDIKFMLLSHVGRGLKRILMYNDVKTWGLWELDSLSQT